MTNQTTDCVLCQPLSDYEVHQADEWRVVVNFNQNKLGKVMLVLNRHDDDITHLSDVEVLSLWDLVRRLRSILTDLFNPDQFNYSFLMNLDSHIHLHMIPRYLTDRTLSGVRFVDSDDVPRHRPDQSVLNELVSLLREKLS